VRSVPTRAERTGGIIDRKLTDRVEGAPGR